MSRFHDWLDHRTGIRAIVHEALYERVPGGPRWRYVWGSTLVFAFVVQMITGFFLWTAYSPNAQGAWESVYYIQHEMQGGWLLRGVHHFMAQAMVVLLVLHLFQVVIDGAYKAPREINFWVGLILMLIVLGLSLTGYLLPWDQKGFWATKVATNIAGSTPVIGPDLQRVIVGGSEYGHHTLTRFFALHAGLLPFLLLALLGLHLYVFRRHGLTPYKADPKRDSTFWPDQLLRDSIACLAVLGVVLFLVFYLGAHLGAPADPNDQYSAARPEWYFLFLFEFLKYFPGETEVIGAIVIPTLVLLVLFLMPILGRWKLGHRFNVAFLLGLLIGIGFLTVTAYLQDRDDAGYIAAVEQADVAAERVPELVEGHGISTAGAAQLVRDDPYLQGPKIFARQCASCHRYHGHDGTGRKVLEEVDGQTVEAKPTAADLGNFGTREWLISLVGDYKDHFQAFQNAHWYQQAKAGELEGEAINLESTAADIDMAGFSNANHELFQSEQGQRDLRALAEYIVSISRRQDVPPPNAALAEQGRALFESATWPAGELQGGLSCMDCHTLDPEQPGPSPDDDGGGIPVLTGYGGRLWLRHFISDPAKHYGGKNQMPAYAERLSERELDLLTRWMTGEYYPTKIGSEQQPSPPAPAAAEPASGEADPM